MTQPQDQPVVLGQGPVPDPVSASTLATAWPEIAALDRIPLAVLTGVLNVQSAPCLPCQADGRSLAHCVMSPPPGCENLAELVSRAARLAAAGAGPPAVRAVITYGDPWVVQPMIDSPGWPDPTAPVQVELWLDPTWGPWRQAVERADQLLELGAHDPTVGPMAIHIRLFPTWSMHAEATEPAGAVALHAAVAAADLLGQGLPFVRALSATETGQNWDDAALKAVATQAGLDMGAWQAAVRDIAPQRLQRDAVDAAAMDLRSAPSWRVDGYRLRGHRSLETLRDIVENQQIDHLGTIPAPLMVAWDPGIEVPPASTPESTPESTP